MILQLFILEYGRVGKNRRQNRRLIATHFLATLGRLRSCYSLSLSALRRAREI
jgi:hypothetical protein